MYQQLSDNALVELLKNSDSRAFEEIYQRYWDRLSLQVLKITGSREDARDIVQEVFVSIWKRRSEIELKGPLVVYLFKSVRNGAIRYIEKNITRNNYLHTLSGNIPLDMTTPASQYDLKELQNKLEQVVANLPPKMQEVYLLSRNEGMSYKEIAQYLGIAENTVRKQLSNARKSIRMSAGELTLFLFAGLVKLFF
ncbi:MAG: RNA polymerase sigma-70 factor [Chitinophagaceae bacterium]|nr:RNA polymerase sigma-70 factor [Chitinophagaceae bacterium]